MLVGEGKGGQLPQSASSSGDLSACRYLRRLGPKACGCPCAGVRHKGLGAIQTGVAEGTRVWAGVAAPVHKRLSEMAQEGAGCVCHQG